MTGGAIRFNVCCYAAQQFAAVALAARIGCIGDEIAGNSGGGIRMGIKGAKVGLISRRVLLETGLRALSTLAIGRNQFDLERAPYSLGIALE